MSEDEKKGVDEGAGAKAAGEEPAAEQGEDAPASVAEDTSEAPSQSDSSAPSEEAPEAVRAETSPPAPAGKAEDVAGIDDDLPWKERRRLERSRRPHRPRPQLSPEERAEERRKARRAKAELRRKQRAAAKAAKGGPGAGTPPVERTPNAPKVRQGIVVSDKAEKSITVRIDIARRHPVYEKIVRTSRRLHAHDERNEAKEGDLVRVVETRPLSKTKRWRLVEILEKAK